MLRYKHQEKVFGCRKIIGFNAKMLKYALTTVLVVQYMQVQSEGTNSTNNICRRDK